MTNKRVGEFGLCEAMVYNDEYEFISCKEPGVCIVEIFKMFHDHHYKRIRCVCAKCGAESTYACIKCRAILYEWSPKHTESECNENIVKNIMNS